MLLSVLAVGLYLASVGFVAFAAAWVRRPIPGRVLALFALLPLAFLLPDLVSGSTHLPTDQMQLLPDANASLEYRPPQNPWLNDVATQFVPWSRKVCDAWLSGQVPLRDRWNGCGSPLSAGGQAGAFSPLVLLGVLLPVSRAFGLAAAIKLMIALSGMWLWLRELSASRGAALFGAISFALSFSIVPWLFFPQAASLAAWPWVFFAVERLRDGGSSRRAFSLLTAVFALWPLLGHIESVVSGASLLAVLLAARWISGDLPDAAKLLRATALAALAGAGLSAFALWPHALAILASNRRVIMNVPFFSPHFSWRPHGAVWPGIVTTLYPHAFGDGIRSPIMIGIGLSFPEMGLGYFGAAGWAAALLVLRPGSRRAGATWALAAALVISLGVGLGLWPFAEIAGNLPIYRWMFPLRILSWVALCGAALAALEIDRFLRDAESAPARAAAGVAAAAALLALFVLDAHRRYYAALGAAEWMAVQKRAVAVSIGTLLIFAACAALSLWKRPLLRRAIPFLMALGCAGELTVQARRQYRLWPVSEMYPPTPMVEFFARQVRPFRVIGGGSTLFPATNFFAGVEDVRTHDPIERRDYVEFLDSQCGYAPADYFKKPQNLNAAALDFLNVRFLLSINPRLLDRPLDLSAEKWRPVYSGPDGDVFENQHVLPRVFAPRTVVGVGPRESSGDRVRSATPFFAAAYPELKRQSDWSQKAFVLGAPAGERANGEAEIGDYAESAARLAFSVRARGAARTVLLVSVVQDGGWSGHDETGRALPTTLANGPFLAVSVPGGAHSVVLDYYPPGARAGLAVSLGMLLSLAVVGIAARARSAATGV